MITYCFMLGSIVCIPENVCVGCILLIKCERMHCRCPMGTYMCVYMRSWIFPFLIHSCALGREKTGLIAVNTDISNNHWTLHRDFCELERHNGCLRHCNWLVNRWGEQVTIDLRYAPSKNSYQKPARNGIETTSPWNGCRVANREREWVQNLG